MEQWALWCDARSYRGVFKRRYSQVADSEFAGCIRGENGKCAKHPGITAAAVMDEVTQCIYKTCDHEGTRGTADFRSNPPSYKCTLLILKVPCDQETDFYFFYHQRTADPRRLWSSPLRPWCVFCLSSKCWRQHKRFFVIFCHLW